MKLKSKNLIIGVTLVSASLLISYFLVSGNIPDQKISPPFPDADIPFSTFSIHPDSAADVIRPTGTRIAIKPGSFITKDGNPVRKTVELKVREFHDASEIARAGIPMSVNGKREDFLQSAGMIEIRAFSEGEELSIRKDKPLDVELAAFRSSDGYRLFHLNSSGSWNTEDSFSISPNFRKAEKMKALSGGYPPPDSSAGEIIFELASDYSEAPEMKSFAGTKWKILKGYDGPDTRLSMRSNWDGFRIKTIDKEKQIYEMVFSRTQDLGFDEGSEIQEITVRAVPVTGEKGANETADVMNVRMNQYEESLQKIEEAKKILAKEADMLNCFKMNNLGVYNIDRIYKMEGFIIASVSFDFENDFDPDIYQMKIFALHEEDNSVIPYSRRDWDHVRFVPDGKMKLLVLLPGNKMAVADRASILSAMQKGGGRLKLNTRKCDAAAYFRNSEVPLAVN